MYQAKHIVKSLRFRLNHPLLHKHIDNIINDANNRLNATVHCEHSAILIALVPFIQTSLSDIQQTLLYKRIEQIASLLIIFAVESTFFLKNILFAIAVEESTLFQCRLNRFNSNASRGCRLVFTYHNSRVKRRCRFFSQHLCDFRSESLPLLTEIRRFPEHVCIQGHSQRFRNRFLVFINIHEQFNLLASFQINESNYWNGVCLGIQGIRVAVQTMLAVDNIRRPIALGDM